MLLCVRDVTLGGIARHREVRCALTADMAS